MTWPNAVFVNVNETIYHLSVSAGRYADAWIFTVDDISAEENRKLLPRTLYLRFDRNKEYLFCLPARAVSKTISDIIAAEIKRHELNWIKGIRF